MIEAGTVIQHTFKVNQQVYDGFKSIFKDENPMHVDEAFAISKGFKERVMYGNILNGFLSYLVGELLPVKNVVIQSQSINFARPVYLNDTVILESKVTGFFESVNSLEMKFKFTNQAGQVVAKGTIQVGII